MNYYAFSAIVTAVVSIGCGLAVLWKNPRGAKNLAFQPLALSVTLWSIFYALWQMSTTAEQALFYIRLSIAFGAFISAFNFHVFLKVFDLENKSLLILRNILFCSSMTAFFSFPTRFFIPCVEERLGFPYWPVPGPFIHLHFINLAVPSIFVLYLIWKKVAQSSPLAKNKLKWLLYGTIVSYTGGMTNIFLWYNIPIKPQLNILTSLGVLVLASMYYRLATINFDFLIRKSLAWILSVTISVASALILLFPFLPHFKPPVLAICCASLGITLHPFVKFGVDFLIVRLGFGSVLSQKRMQQESDKIKESSYTYQDLARNLVQLIINTLPVERAAVYLFDRTKKDIYLAAQRGMKNQLVSDLRFNRSSLALSVDDPLIALLGSEDSLLNMETLLNETDTSRTQPVLESLHRLEAELVIPFNIGGKLNGCLAVGPKKNGSLFDQEEIESILAFARMGTEIMRYIAGYEAELHHTALYSHDMNHDIRSLTQTLEFLASPLAQNQPDEKKKSLLDQALRVSGRLYDSFQMNRDRSTLIMKTIRGEYEKAPVHISEILKISTGKFTLQAEKANVLYKVNIEPAKTLLQGNEEDLIRLTDNLIANALRYVPQTGGLIEVTGRNKEQGYEIRVKDNGDGIEPENLEKIWDLGWQATGDKKKGSSGFGLSIVRQIVQAHDGTIQALSQGKRKGTEFVVNFPITTREGAHS